MKNVLIISNNEENIAVFDKAVNRNEFLVVKAVSQEHAEIILNDMNFDIVLIDGEYNFTNEIRAEFIISTKESDGAFFVPEISEKMISAVFCWIELTDRKSKKLQEKNNVLQKKIDDMSIINRAKLILIKTLGITENEAHKYIEKKAMEMRITKSEVAKSIILTYEN